MARDVGKAKEGNREMEEERKTRDHNREFQDNAGRRYAYDFDVVLRKYLVRTFVPYVRPDGATLELGCFRGDMTELILELTGKVSIIEAASELAVVVRERFGERVSVMTASFEEAEVSERFDNVFLVHGLEHLDDPVLVLGRAGRWLAPGGRLLVAVPNANALSRQIAVRMGLIDFNSAVTLAEREQGHRFTYSSDTLRHHLRAAGLKIVAEGGVLVKPLANVQFDRALDAGVVDQGYLDGCYELGRLYPDLCASLYAICERE